MALGSVSVLSSAAYISETADDVHVMDDGVKRMASHLVEMIEKGTFTSEVDDGNGVPSMCFVFCVCLCVF